MSISKSSSSSPYLYGIHAVRAAFLNPDRQISQLILSQSSLAEFSETLAEAKRQKLKRPEPIVKTKDFFEQKLPPGVVHQQILLYTNPLDQPSLYEIVAQNETEPHFVVILDQVTDPQNIGSIMRSACAFGAKALIVQEKNSPDITPIIAKNASGAVEYLPYIQENNLSATMTFLKEKGYWCYGLAEEGSEALHKIAFPEKTVLIMGAEGKGLRRLIRENCDQLCALPTQEPLPTLNVANAAAATFYAWRLSFLK
jgi:23S rRNA (guanosine2251-2'-O)-methyltransferase